MNLINHDKTINKYLKKFKIYNNLLKDKNIKKNCILNIFNQISQNKFRYFLSNLKLKCLKNNQIIYKKGEEPFNFYFILQGEVIFYIKNQEENNNFNKIKILKKGKFFCHLEIFDKNNRNFAVKTNKNYTILGIIEKKIFLRIFNITFFTNKKILKNLQKIFEKNLELEEYKSFAIHTEKIIIKKNENLYFNTDRFIYIYIIVKGRIELYENYLIKNIDKEKSNKMKYDIRENFNFLGIEEYLKKSKNYLFNAISLTDVELLKIDYRYFKKIEKNLNNFKPKFNKIWLKYLKFTNYKRSLNFSSLIDLDEFKNFKEIEIKKNRKLSFLDFKINKNKISRKTLNFKNNNKYIIRNKKKSNKKSKNVKTFDELNNIKKNELKEVEIESNVSSVEFKSKKRILKIRKNVLNPSTCFINKIYDSTNENINLQRNKKVSIIYTNNKKIFSSNNYFKKMTYKIQNKKKL